MARVSCSKCNHGFDPSNYLVKGGGLAAGAAGGAWIGAGLGIVGGPLGGIAGTVPGAIIGGTLGYLGISKFARCPSCTKVFMI